VSTNNKILTTYTETNIPESVLFDRNEPLPYKDWYKINTSLVPGEEFTQYNNYLTVFFKKKKEQNIEFNYDLRKNYINLLEQLQIFFNDSQAEEWYKYVNFNDEKELLAAIPYFARKLKEIAVRYINTREEIKKNKIKSNILGTNTGIIQQLQEQLLSFFTKNNKQEINIPNIIWSNISELSSVKNTLTITVEELYDDQLYFDQSSSLPTSAYYDFTHQDFIDYFNLKNIPLTANTWIYSQGTFDLTNILNFADDLLKKYTSENKYILTNIPEISAKIDYFNISVSEGNNIFYWPYGFYRPDMSTITRYIPIPLSAAGIEGLGTGGTSILNSDTIFVKTSRGIEGAWLKYNEYEEESSSLKAYIEGNKKTSFRLPFPGYGLSAEDAPWTGPSLQFTPEYSYLRPDIKQNVTTTYWNTNAAASGFAPISINETTLVEQGAFASERYPLADKIKIGAYVPLYNDSAFNGDMQEVWLYKMTKTDIPIGSNYNLIVWPYERIDSLNPFPTYYPSNLNTVCQPISLSGISLPYSTSSNSIENADIIYKLNHYQDTPDLASECAWLSGRVIVTNQVSAVSQPGLNVIFNPYTFTNFIWEGPDYTNINDVFKSLNHQPDCSYVLNNGTPKEPFLCTCRQTLFTPFGHPGNAYSDYSNTADFIFENEKNNNINDIKGWTDTNNTTYTESTAFGWFKTNNKAGWGDGTWYAKGTPNLSSTNSSTQKNFYLRYGRRYTYYRAGSNSITDYNTAPSLTVRYAYTNNSAAWIKGIKDTNTGKWSSTGAITDMVIYPGDVLLYKKTPSTTFYTVTGIDSFTSNTFNENRSSVWSDFNYISIGTNSSTNTQQKVNVSYPTTFYPATTGSEIPSGYPLVPYGNIVSINWVLNSPSNQITEFDNKSNFNFAPTETGIYTIYAIAITAQQVLPNKTYTSSESGLYIINNIPSITAVTSLISSTSYFLSSFSVPTPGFVLNCPLYGWNYNTNTPSPAANGARPYWATSSTIYKDIDSWGAPFRIFDNYNIITQPSLADVVLQTNSYFEYDRTYPKSFTWSQPILFRNYVYKNSWCDLKIDINAVSNFKDILNNLTNQVTIRPLSTLSPLNLSNDVDNEPVEVFYKASNTFNWAVSTVPILQNLNITAPEINLISQPTTPWSNLNNRFYPTIAILPSLNNLYSENEKGGFFTANKLGASIYTSNNFTTNSLTSASNLSGVFNDSAFTIGGRSLSKTDLPTPYYTITENNIWLKEPITSGQIAGNIKKNITKKYQKFIPYQSKHETNPNFQTGLIIPTSRQSPWGGPTDTLWADYYNKPETYTGILNVSAWAQSQILKQNSKALDYWTTDIFGNQYGLFKNLNNTLVYQRNSIPGELWVRKNSQQVASASVALTSIFNTYSSLNLYNLLTGNGINKVDVFFDTLYIETSSCVLFENIKYDFETDTIYSIKDNSRFLSLALPVQMSLTREFSGINLDNYIYAKPGETWFFPERKNIILSVCGLSGKVLTPQLFEYNISTRNFAKIFPNTNDTLTINSLTANNFINIEAPILTYDNLKKEYVMSVLCKNSNSTSTIVEFTIIDLPDTYLDTITLYTPNTATLNAITPPVVTHSLIVNVPSNTTTTFQVTPINNPTSFSITNPTIPGVSVNNTGLFSITPPTTSSYFVPFAISNSSGTTYYSLNINAT
jgi:hypothetical protein